MEKLGNEDKDIVNDARFMYYSNQIIYEREENEKKMRISNKFLEFLKFQNASKITYDHNHHKQSDKLRIDYAKYDTFNLKKNLERKFTNVKLSK